MADKNNQVALVREYIDRHGSITSMDAVKDMGVLRLSARIKDLRDAGENIVTVWEQSKNRDGNMVRYARYMRG